MGDGAKERSWTVAHLGRINGWGLWDSRDLCEDQSHKSHFSHESQPLTAPHASDTEPALSPFRPLAVLPQIPIRVVIHTAFGFDQPLWSF